MTVPPYTDQEVEDDLATLHLNTATRSDVVISSRWTKLIGVLTLGSGGLSIFVFIVAFIVGWNTSAPSSGIGETVIGGLIILAIMVLYTYIGWLMYQYGKSLSELTAQEELIELGAFFDQQHRLWRFVGIYISVLIAFIIIIVLAAVPNIR